MWHTDRDVISTSSTALGKTERETVIKTLKDNGVLWLVELQESEVWKTRKDIAQLNLKAYRNVFR